MGKILRRVLNNDGVRTEYTEIDDYPTGVSSFSKLSNNKLSELVLFFYFLFF